MVSIHSDDMVHIFPKKSLYNLRPAAPKRCKKTAAPSSQRGEYNKRLRNKIQKFGWKINATLVEAHTFGS